VCLKLAARRFHCDVMEFGCISESVSHFICPAVSTTRTCAIHVFAYWQLSMSVSVSGCKSWCVSSFCFGQSTSLLPYRICTVFSCRRRLGELRDIRYAWTASLFACFQTGSLSYLWWFCPDNL
jgi:hypothetical protein